jgi:hypothetical protein
VKLTPGENVSAIVRVLEEPKTTLVGERKLIIAKVSDAETIGNLIAWDAEANRWNLSKDDLAEITLGLCPRSAARNQPPTIEVTAETKIKKVTMVFPTIDECMRTRFLDEVSDYEYANAEGFIVEVASTVSHHCEECGLPEDDECECGAPVKEVFRIDGGFSDGTAALRFSTISERAAEDLSQTMKKESISLNPQNLMRTPHRILGYLRDGRLYVEEVLE